MNDDQRHLKTPKKIADLFSGYPGLWMVAGGWAIDLFLNKNTRKHNDIEIATPRSEQLDLKKYLNDWGLKYVISGEFFDWEDNQFLELPIHEIHGTNDLGDTIEILFNEIENDMWNFRRNLNIEYPLDKAIIKSPSGIPILAPEIVLLYKAKWKEEKDYHDLTHALPRMSTSSKKWLKDNIELNHGPHEWIEKIR